MDKPPHKYHVLYQIEHKLEGITKEELQKLPGWENFGASDAIFLASFMYPEDGSLSVKMVSLDGRNGKDLEDLELFKLWTMLAHRLSDSKTLGPNQKEFATIVIRSIREAMLRGREGEENKS